MVQKETCTPAITSSSRPTCSANIAKHHLIDPVGSERQQRFGLDKRDALPRYCLDCDLRFACHGGCPKDLFTTTPDGQPGLHYLCSSFSCSSTSPRTDATDGCTARPNPGPSEIRQIYADRDARRSRNDPCTCGSGRKWKHCTAQLLSAV